LSSRYSIRLRFSTISIKNSRLILVVMTSIGQSPVARVFDHPNSCGVKNLDRVCLAPADPALKRRIVGIYVVCKCRRYCL
jgi:hypothetical protein